MTTERPQRIQRQRTKGWRMPPNTVYVGRGSAYGNPFVVGERSGVFNDGKPDLIEALTLEQCIGFYRDLTSGFLSPEMHPRGHDFQRQFRRRFIRMSLAEAARCYLRGRNLACWCPLVDKDGKPVPCHADVLLEIANV